MVHPSLQKYYENNIVNIVQMVHLNQIPFSVWLLSFSQKSIAKNSTIHFNLVDDTMKMFQLCLTCQLYVKEKIRLPCRYVRTFLAVWEPTLTGHILNGIDLTRCSKHSSEILLSLSTVATDSLASHQYVNLIPKVLVTMEQIWVQQLIVMLEMIWT